MTVALTTQRSMQYRDLPGVKLRQAASRQGVKPLPRVCMWCCGPLSGRQQSWCSQACVDEYLVRKGGKRTRELVYERDQGVCAHCRVDTDAIARQLDAWRDRALAPIRARTTGTLWDREYSAAHAAVYDEYTRLLHSRLRVGSHGHLWEAHHVTAVVEGGGWCGLDGYVTLCMKCHHAESAELQRRRRHERSTAAQ